MIICGHFYQLSVAVRLKGLVCMCIVCVLSLQFRSVCLTMVWRLVLANFRYSLVLLFICSLPRTYVCPFNAVQALWTQCCVYWIMWEAGENSEIRCAWKNNWRQTDRFSHRLGPGIQVRGCLWWLHGSRVASFSKRFSKWIMLREGITCWVTGQQAMYPHERWRCCHHDAVFSRRLGISYSRKTRPTLAP